MIAEAYKIVQAMEKAMPPSMDYVNINNPGATHSYLSILMSRLLVVLAEDAEKSADRLSQQTDKLIHHSDTLTQQTDKLLTIVEEQRNLAKTLEGQTNALIALNRTLIWLTVGLLVFTIILAVCH